MVFTGLEADAFTSGAWTEAIERSSQDVALWRDVVGVAALEKQTDSGLTRLVEWGGMEVEWGGMEVL